MFAPTVQLHPLAIEDFAFGMLLLAISTSARTRTWRLAFRLLGYALFVAGILEGPRG